MITNTPEDEYKGFLEVTGIKHTKTRHDYFVTGFRIGRTSAIRHICEAYCKLCSYNLICKKPSDCRIVDDFEREIKQFL